MLRYQPDETIEISTAIYANDVDLASELPNGKISADIAQKPIVLQPASMSTATRKEEGGDEDPMETYMMLRRLTKEDISGQDNIEVKSIAYNNVSPCTFII